MQGFLRMLDEVYGVFGLEYSMALSTRPEGYLGELDMWNKVCSIRRYVFAASVLVRQARVQVKRGQTPVHLL